MINSCVCTKPNPNTDFFFLRTRLSHLTDGNNRSFILKRLKSNFKIWINLFPSPALTTAAVTGIWGLKLFKAKWDLFNQFVNQQKNFLIFYSCYWLFQSLTSFLYLFWNKMTRKQVEDFITRFWVCLRLRLLHSSEKIFGVY